MFHGHAAFVYMYVCVRSCGNNRNVLDRREYATRVFTVEFSAIFFASSFERWRTTSRASNIHPRTYHRYLFLAMMTANTRRMFRAIHELQRKNKYPTRIKSSVSPRYIFQDRYTYTHTHIHGISTRIARRDLRENIRRIYATFFLFRLNFVKKCKQGYESQ